MLIICWTSEWWPTTVLTPTAPTLPLVVAMAIVLIISVSTSIMLFVGRTISVTVRIVSSVMVSPTKRGTLSMRYMIWSIVKIVIMRTGTIVAKLQWPVLIPIVIRTTIFLWRRGFSSIRWLTKKCLMILLGKHMRRSIVR